MAMRGAAPTAVCPRCGATSPPTDEPLAHCATCKLAFDPRVEHLEQPRRARTTSEPVPGGLEIERTDDAHVVRWSFDKLRGFGALALGVICAAMLFGNLRTPDESVRDMVLLGAAAAGLLFIGAVFAFGEIVLRIDNRGLTVRRRPIAGAGAVDVSRSDIQDVQVATALRGWQVTVRTPRGVTIAAALETEAQAECIAEVIRDALVNIPAV
jgi:hypothetical protein